MIEPRSVKGVTHWLVSHEGKEREVALRFLGEVRFKPSKDSILVEKAREGLESPMSNVSLTRRSRKKRSPHGKNCSCAVCDADHSNRILRALYNQGSSSVIDEMRRALECVPRPKKTKELLTGMSSFHLSV
ncbi:hypothetical protein AC249_AIPGENE16588 [Exaiptasia diaphana]|nr:hypothetical protein AC249_AIPGENE16588 [Exaiptasia diaphana]